MNEYVIGFHIHFHSLVCKKKLTNIKEFKIKLIPVPRSLSSSCGTALRIITDLNLDLSLFDCIEFESIYKINNDGTYTLLSRRD